jgi:two-component system, LytTR family, response regulator
MKTRVLIVDDEPIARRGIRRYLAKHNGIEIVGEAANGVSAVEQINELHPDIVFLDVQMPDLDGFGVIENVEPSASPAPVYVFVTAHDVHAIRAFEVHAVDYLLKPYDKERFAKALAHALQVVEQRGTANRGLEPLLQSPLLQSLRNLRPLERFVVKDKKRIFFVPVANVLWIEAAGNYACIHTANDTHLLRESLANLEEKLAPHHFIRVRKSAIVNSACISEIRPMFDGVYDIVLTEGTVVSSSRRYAYKLRALLES